MYQYDLNGVNASQRFENNASDFKETSVIVEHSGQVDQYTRGAALRSFECAGACLLRSIRFLSPPTNDFLLNVIPFSNTFSPNPRTAFSYGVSIAHQVDPTNAFGYDSFISPGIQFTQQKIRRISNFTHDVFPDQYGGDWVIGYAPPFFRGLISGVENILYVGKPPSPTYVSYNNRTEYFLTPSFDTIGHKLSDYSANVLIPYELYDSTNRLVQSGSLFEGIKAPQLSIQLPTAGRYGLKLLKNYNVLDAFNTIGKNYTATTTATVDTTQLSSKAPVFEMVGYDVNGKPSNQVNFRKGTNQLKFSVVPAPGTTFNVSLDFGSSAAGIPMQSVPLTASGSTYEGMIPNVRFVSVVPANFKITVADNTSNQLVYDFQLPITAISSGIKNNGSSTIKGIVKIVVQKKQNDGTWNTVQTVYNQEQTISPNSTFFVSDVFNPVTVTLSNKGNYRIKEGFYRQLSGGGLDPLQSTDGSMEYTKTFTIS